MTEDSEHSTSWLLSANAFGRDVSALEFLIVLTLVSVVSVLVIVTWKLARASNEWKVGSMALPLRHQRSHRYARMNKHQFPKLDTIHEHQIFVNDAKSC
ncbi:TPA: hypothetical protein N0F65_000804 [Lagenidium giganteum]|uniref:Uncharacterized protein n=1 Tax=Lagenidium giganteum TaxID=4803 RepID=A0AAV2ZGK5_9STRA|nr:TPA: hypothetical protein N0F65_000804 [Lagenidium giganteum]